MFKPKLIDRYIQFKPYIKIYEHEYEDFMLPIQRVASLNENYTLEKFSSSIFNENYMSDWELLRNGTYDIHVNQTLVTRTKIYEIVGLKIRLRNELQLDYKYQQCSWLIRLVVDDEKFSYKTYEHGITLKDRIPTVIRRNS